MLFQKQNQKHIKRLWSVVVILLILSMTLAYVIPLFA